MFAELLTFLGTHILHFEGNNKNYIVELCLIVKASCGVVVFVCEGWDGEGVFALLLFLEM